MANVFEFLGLPANYRPKNKVVQLVKHWREVPDSRKCFPYIAQVKKDGVFAMVVVCNGKVGIFGRTGAALTSCQYYINGKDLYSLSEGVYIGELLSRQPCSLEELSGVVNPERVNELTESQGDIADQLYIAFHDYLEIPEFIAGKSELSYQERHNNLDIKLWDTEVLGDILPYSIVYDTESMDAFTMACLDAGEEGAVYKNVVTWWKAGHKGFHQMKQVGSVSYDLECVGYEEGSGKYEGKVANLIFRWRDGETIKAMLGKGWTHKNAEMMFYAITNKLPQPSVNPLGAIFTVKGLCDSSKGRIRLPKVGERRHDKTKADY